MPLDYDFLFAGCHYASIYYEQQGNFQSFFATSDTGRNCTEKDEKDFDGGGDSWRRWSLIKMFQDLFRTVGRTLADKDVAVFGQSTDWLVPDWFLLQMSDG
jgi:hypothetical protein